MIETIRNAWKIPELKKKIVYTIIAMLIFRIGAVIPVPFVNTVALGSYLEGGRSRLGGERTSPRSPPRAGPHPQPRPAGEFSLNV